MPFEARILVHGVANFVPHTDGTKLLALFPDQAYAMDRGIRAPEGGEICKHYMVVQMDARVLDPRLPPKLWLTLEVAKHWIGFESDDPKPMELKEGKIDGLTQMESLLEGAGFAGSPTLDRRALPGSDFDSRLLAAGFFADAGRVSPAAEFQGPFEMRASGGGGWKEVGELSSVMRLELGTVGRFALKLLPFGAPPEDIATIELHPLGDTLDVWVRHFCDLDRPDPNRDVPKPRELDADFVLNYALREGLEDLIEQGMPLEVPRVADNWKEGGSVAGKPRQCMGALSSARSFMKPEGF